jgi:hypothetical protein
VVVLGIDADDAFELAGGRRSGVGALALPALLRNPPTLPISSIWVLAFVDMTPFSVMPTQGVGHSLSVDEATT